MYCRAHLAVFIGVLLILVCGTPSIAQTSPTTAPAGATQEQLEFLWKLGNRGIGVHDPSTIIKYKDEYWAFTTGGNAPSIRSKDMINWVRGPRAVPNPPNWVREVAPRNRGNDFWAPDVIKAGEKYMLFYSVSSFGRNTSAIGVATNATLDPDDPAFKWIDGGIVLRSTQQDDFNAIDPAVIIDKKDGKMWMSFGSFWSGIKMIELDPKTGLRVAADSPVYALAYSETIEAPYIYQHGKYYYLFVNHGLCCRGANSTYHLRVGRSDKITGPYMDKDGKDLRLAGGTIVANTDGVFTGPGHAGILEENGKFLFSCHFYDATSRGASRLSIRPLTWSDDGWPVVGKW